MRILLIEDDPIISRSLALALKEASYAIDVAEDGERGYFLSATNPYDLIIMDYNLPLLNGREIVSRLREEKINTPILMLTVRSETDDRVDMLNIGADDYLSKPFALSEVIARIRAMLRRPPIVRNNIIQCGKLKMDCSAFEVNLGKKKLNLSGKEFSLLEYLMQNTGRVLSRGDIMEHVWDENANPFSNTIEVHIKNIRKKLGSARDMILTYPNRGYRLNDK